jgi:hypothetical protein
VRPVREQLEHDRVIRLLQNRFRRRYEVGINPGQEQNAAVGSGTAANYPDVVLLASDRGRRLQGVIEVETAESVNNLEAMAQWARLAKLRAPFHLYVPASAVDVARRLCTGRTSTGNRPNDRTTSIGRSTTKDHDRRAQRQASGAQTCANVTTKVEGLASLAIHPRQAGI